MIGPTTTTTTKNADERFSFAKKKAKSRCQELITQTHTYAVGLSRALASLPVPIPFDRLTSHQTKPVVNHNQNHAIYIQELQQKVGVHQFYDDTLIDVIHDNAAAVMPFGLELWLSGFRVVATGLFASIRVQWQQTAYDKIWTRILSFCCRTKWHALIKVVCECAACTWTLVKCVNCVCIPKQRKTSKRRQTTAHSNANKVYHVQSSTPPATLNSKYYCKPSIHLVIIYLLFIICLKRQTNGACMQLCDKHLQTDNKLINTENTENKKKEEQIVCLQQC